MPLPAPLFLQQLERLDRSSPEFSHQLIDVLRGQEYRQRVQNLQGSDLTWLVDYLDEALPALDPSSHVFRKCLRELRSICRSKRIVPTSYTIPSHRLVINTNPFSSGAYGDVHQGTLDGTKVCAKRVRVYTREGIQKVTKALCGEAPTLKRLAHPNIVPFLGVTFTPFQLVSPWISLDLPKYIEKNPQADRLQLLSDAATGLCYLHSCNVVHGDLKGGNILVDDSGRARIADVGLALITRGVDSELSTSGDEGHGARWAAPEILNDQGGYSKEADVFSFAMVMSEVFTGAVPFHDKTSAAAATAILKGQRPPRPRGTVVTEELWRLMESCWALDPRLRPDMLKVLQGLHSQSRSSYGEKYIRRDTHHRSSDDGSTSDSAPSITHPTTQNPGLTITNGDGMRRASPLRSPPDPSTSPAVHRYGDQPQEPPRTGNPRGGIGRRFLRKIICGLR